jgi:hypothetical protein
MVGAIGNAGDSDNAYNTYTVGDQAECNANGIDYQPCVLPGDVSARQRAHGDFMWRQFYNMVRAGVQGIYISMFDEYGEGNQIAKTAETLAWVPAGSGFLTSGFLQAARDDPRARPARCGHPCCELP